MPEFTLTELCDRVGVSPRTVRYYISQGLLASPERRGPGATYRGEHLDRLVLILKLKERHLPLSKIREILDRMSDEDIRAGQTPDLDPDPDSAYTYIRGVLNQQAASGPAATPDPKVRASRIRHLQQQYPDVVKAIQAMASPLRARILAKEPPSSSTTPTRSTWEHHTITHNIELHVRRPLSREEDRRVRELLREAFALFRREDP